MKIYRALFLLSFILFSSCQSTKSKDTTTLSKAESPSSEIPLRREFPVDPKVHPCKDFYQHTCNPVIASFQLREDRSKHLFAFDDSAERLLEAKKKFFLQIQNEKKLGARGNQLKNFYFSCIDEAARKTEELETVQRYLKDMDSIKTNEDFQNLIVDRVVKPDYSPLGIDDIANQDFPNRWDFYFLYEFQTLPERSYYSKTEVVADFKKVATAFYSTIGKQQPEILAQRLIDFETQFSKVYPLPEEFRDLISKRLLISASDLIKKYPNLRLKNVLSKLSKTTQIRDLTPANLEFLNKAFAEMPVDHLKDIYLFHALGGLMDVAYPEYFQTRFDFERKHLGGPEKRSDLQERCTKSTMARFGKELDSELLPRLFPKFPREKFVKLAEKVRASILEGIQKNSWLSPAAKKAAYGKIRVAQLQLVSPKNDHEWDFNPIAQYDAKTYLANMGTLKMKLTEKTFEEMKQKRSSDMWSMSPLMINAYYSLSDNKFVMPIGILQYPFYDPSLPDEVNLGAVGAVIGHELGHAIDDKGSRYDESGRLKQWMSDVDLKEFEKRGGRLASQFDKAGYNGKLTLGENIGDFVGVTFAYQAAFPDGVGTIEQKRNFFYQYGRVWCGILRPKLRERMLKTNPHPAGEARVNEQVKHQPGFKTAFQCKEKDDPMTLPDSERIKIW